MGKQLKLNLSGAIICYNSNRTFGKPICTNIFEIRTGIKRKSSRIEIPVADAFIHWPATPNATFESDFEEGGPFYLSPRLGERPVHCEFVYGDPKTAAIYRPSKDRHQIKVENRDIRSKNLLRYCRENYFNMQSVLSFIERLDCDAHAPGIESLRALEVAEWIYGRLVDVRVDLRICLKGLHTSPYSRYVQLPCPNSIFEKSKNPN